MNIWIILCPQTENRECACSLFTLYVWVCLCVGLYSLNLSASGIRSLWSWGYGRLLSQSHSMGAGNCSGFPARTGTGSPLNSSRPFYSARDPNPWDDTTNIHDPSQLLSETSLEADTPRGCTPPRSFQTRWSRWRWRSTTAGYILAVGKNFL